MPPLVEIFSPRAETKVQGVPIRPLPESLDGKVLGFLNNDKPNADILLEKAEELLMQRYRPKEVVRAWKPQTGAHPTPSQMKDLLRADLVVNALGD